MTTIMHLFLIAYVDFVTLLLYDNLFRFFDVISHCSIEVDKLVERVSMNLDIQRINLPCCGTKKRKTKFSFINQRFMNIKVL